MQKLGLAGTVVTLGLLAAVDAAATTVTFLPIADGSVRLFGGEQIDDTSTSISLSRSGALDIRAVLEYDLSGLPTGAIITEASLAFTLTGRVSNTGGNPAKIDIFAFGGDGLITAADFDAIATQVVDSSTPLGGSAGDVRSFAFDTVAPIEAVLPGGALALRIQTQNFATVGFASLENATRSAAVLSVTYDAPTDAPTPIPLPAGAPLMIGAFGLLAALRGRKTNPR